MANSDKNIIITPNIGSTTADPSIVFSGANGATGPQNITLKAYPLSNGTLSFEGSAGQLFSITNSLTGTLFSVNDVSGMPSIEVMDTGDVKVAQYSGNVGIGTGTPNTKLSVNGTITTTALLVGNSTVNTQLSGNGLILTAGANSIQLTNGTSNWIGWNTSGTGAPTVTTRSAGTKLLLNPSINATATDYAIGLEASHMWFSGANNSSGFKWYSNTTNIMTVNTSILSLANTSRITFIGNSTVNSSMNLTSLSIRTSTGQVRVGNNTSFTTLSPFGVDMTDTLTGGNFGISANYIYIQSAAPELTVATGNNTTGFNAYAGDSSHKIDIGATANGQTTCNVSTVNTSFMSTGNDTVNAVYGSTFLRIGNTTVNTTINATSITVGSVVANLVSSTGYSYNNLTNVPIAANAPYANVTFASTITLTDNSNIRITCTGNTMINPPASGTDGSMVRMWLIASGANVAVSVNTSIKIPSTSAFTSPQTIVNTQKARMAIQYDSVRAVWELVTFVNGY